MFCDDDDDDDASSKKWKKKKRDDEKQKRKKKKNKEEDLRVRFRVVRDGHGISGRPKRPKLLFKKGGHPSK